MAHIIAGRWLMNIDLPVKNKTIRRSTIDAIDIKNRRRYHQSTTDSLCLLRLIVIQFLLIFYNYKSRIDRGVKTTGKNTIKSSSIDQSSYYGRLQWVRVKG